ncbi:hypothetical protein PHMEG_00035936 [Phytophthora megakarya]|uniref:Uncharacterized protein n=1 Tax=Phytophthora megakarya TaxID=4795 RepID=A0A225UN20_9STRA|nr:hypothetical protein PHMEG_00035936 [Phytophthora megakarya]
MATPDRHKFALPFIFDVPIRQTRQSTLIETVVVPVGGKTGATTDTKAVSTLSKEEKKRRRTCKIEGCRNYIVRKGLCCRHGDGGKHCEVNGCIKPAYERTHNLYKLHFVKLRNNNYSEM